MHDPGRNLDRWHGQADFSNELPYFPTIPLPYHVGDEPLAISDMADIFGVTHRTVHFYEEKQLQRAERSGTMRVYAPDQIRQMALVNLCREIGVPIVQIQELLSDLRAARSQSHADLILHEVLKARKSELASDAALIRRQMQQITEILSLGDDGYSSSAVEETPFLDEFETECLALMAEGYTPLRISGVTGRSVNAILETEARIIQKFGSSNRFQAVAKAVLLGIVGRD